MTPMTHDETGRLVSLRYERVAKAKSILEKVVHEIPDQDRPRTGGIIRILEDILKGIAADDDRLSSMGD